MTAQPIDDDPNRPQRYVTRAVYYAALAEIDDLKEEIAYLRSELVVARGLENWQRVYVAVPGLTPAQAGMIAALHATKAVVSDPGLYEASKTVDHRRRSSNDWCEVVKVHICRARKRIVTLGGPQTSIQAHWGIGYRMTDEGREWLDKRLATLAAVPHPAAPETAPTATQSRLNGNPGGKP